MGGNFFLEDLQGADCRGRFLANSWAETAIEAEAVVRTIGEANDDGVALQGAKSGQIEVAMAAMAQSHISNMSTVSQLDWTGRRWKQ